MGISRIYIVLLLIIGIISIGCWPQVKRESGYYSQRDFPSDTIGNYNLMVKFNGDKINSVQDSCQYYSLNDGIIEIENILDTNLINNKILKSNLVIDSIYIYTKDTTYSIMVDSIINYSDSSDSKNCLILELNIPDSLFLSCFESCIDISYWVQVSESDKILSSHHFSHKLLAQNEDDRVNWVDIALIPNAFPSSFRYLSPHFYISYDIPESSQVLIKIYNICGQVVDTVVNEVQPPGYHEREWGNKNLPDGIYFIQIKADDSTIVKKHLLLK